MRFDEISISSAAPRLLISAADVRTGEFRILRSHAIDKEPADQITSRCDLGFGGGAPALSSRSSERARVFGWPVCAESSRSGSSGRRPGEGEGRLPPNELWVIMINPLRQERAPKRMDDIRDHRNELAANISFRQEIFFIGKMDKLAGRDLLADKAKDKYHPIKVRAITMSDDVAASLAMNPS